MTTRPILKPQSVAEYARVEQLSDPSRPYDAMQQHPHWTNVSSILYDYFKERRDVLVGGDGYLCLDTRDGSARVAPDCLVALRVDADAIRSRNGYVIGEVGKPPDFVLEIASESTGRADYTTKREVYAAFGVTEYWRFDHTGGEYHDAALAGDRLIDSVYEPIPLYLGEDSVIRGHSDALGLGLHWDVGRLRFYDPVTREYLPDLTESKAQRDAAIRERDAEIEGRRYAEERATQAEAELERLREQVRRQP